MDIRTLKDESSEESEAFLTESGNTKSEHVPTTRTGRGVIWYLRIVLELAMAATILFLLFQPLPSDERALRKSPVPQCMHTPPDVWH